MKKITILGTAYPYRGGIAVFNERMAKAFQEKGYKTDIYTFTLQYPNILFPGKSQYSEDPPPANMKITQAVSSINPLNWWKVGRELARNKSDLVIAKFWLPFMGPCLGSIARLVKKNGHTRFMTVIDNIIPHEKRPGDRLFANYFAQACDGFVTMSRSVSEDLKQFTDNPHVSYLPHPIYDNFGEKISKPEARKWLGLGMDEKVLLFFGIVRRYKGLDILLKAMADERIKEKNIKVIVAGEYYDDAAYYEDLISKFDIADSVISKPEFISNEEVKYYFCGTDMVVQPYRSATQSGISQMAYHFESPMLVTNVGGLPEIVPDGKVGYVTEVRPKAVADAILDFYENDREATFRNNVVQEKARFSWDAFTEGVIELYKSL